MVDKMQLGKHDGFSSIKNLAHFSITSETITLP